jgi:hypothetical protein
LNDFFVRKFINWLIRKKNYKYKLKTNIYLSDLSIFKIKLIENHCYKIIKNFQKLSDFSFPECVSFRFKCCIKYCLKNVELSLFEILYRSTHWRRYSCLAILLYILSKDTSFVLLDRFAEGLNSSVSLNC